MPVPWRAWPALSAVVLLAVAAVAAPTGDQWGDEPRAVAAWPDGGGFAVRSTRDTSLATDEIAAAYDAGAALLTVTLRSVDPSEATVSMALALQAVTEFHDADGDGRYSLGEPVVRRVEVPGTPATTALQALPGGGWRATSTHSLPAPPGALAAGTATSRLEVELVARPEADGGLEPTRLDLDVRLLDGWARNGTHLALEAALGSTAAAAGADADAARMRDGEHALTAAWQDGRGALLEGNDDRSMTFVRAQPAGHVVSFPAALSASWEPARDGGLRGPGGDALLYAGAAVVAAAAFLLPAWRRMRSA